MNDDAELIGGREPREILVVPHDSSWPDRFEIEHGRITRALGDRVFRIDHVGSTSVPGLAAKPIVDIDLSVDDPEDENSYVPDLLEAGYLLRVREPAHRMLRTPELDVHVHVCAAGSEWERTHLLFRDWLRISPGDCKLYAAVKEGLAGRLWPDMNDYAAAKTDVIADIIGRAERWSAETRWTPA